MNVERTREYYASLTEKDLCQCDYCLNLMKLIRVSYPEVATYLGRTGVDIAKPFESWPLEPDEKGEIMYLDVQYVVFGDEEEFEKTKIGDVEIRLAESHPMTDILERHYVIEVSPIRLKWEM